MQTLISAENQANLHCTYGIIFTVSSAQQNVSTFPSIRLIVAHYCRFHSKTCLAVCSSIRCHNWIPQRARFIQRRTVAAYRCKFVDALLNLELNASSCCVPTSRLELSQLSLGTTKVFNLMAGAGNFCHKRNVISWRYDSGWRITYPLKNLHVQFCELFWVVRTVLSSKGDFRTL